MRSACTLDLLQLVYIFLGKEAVTAAVLTREPTTATRSKVAWVAVVPAYNEQIDIGDTIKSLLGQTRPPEQVIVVSDNSSDWTAAIVRKYEISHPGKVLLLHSVNNSGKKAGALNLGLEYLRLSGMPEFVLTMDGDTMLDKHFAEYALRIHKNKPNTGGVCATCAGKDIKADTLWQKYLLECQKMEYARCEAARLVSNLHVLSGAGTMLRREALLDVYDFRGFFYDEHSIVEDYELTVKMKDLGYRARTNERCRAYTDLLPTRQMLFKQRIRWAGGTLQELRRNGLKRSTALGWFSYGTGYLMSVVFAFSIAYNVATQTFDALWLYVGAMVAVENARRVRKLGLKYMLISLLYIPEQIYNLLRQAWMFKALWVTFTKKLTSW